MKTVLVLLAINGAYSKPIEYPTREDCVAAANEFNRTMRQNSGPVFPGMAACVPGARGK
jgi:hypothetical protein